VQQSRPHGGWEEEARFILEHIATWIQGAKALQQMGMPSESFSLALHRPSKKSSQQLSDGVIRAAIWHDEAAEIARREQRAFGYNTYGITEDFVDLMKEMVRGNIPAGFDADMGEVWDIEKVLRENKGDWHWPASVSRAFGLDDFDEPDGGWEKAREGYVEKVEWADRIDGWSVMVGG
jgi:hypothetical protein